MSSTTPISQSSFQNPAAIGTVKKCSITLLALGALNLIAGVYVLLHNHQLLFSRHAIPFNAASGGYMLGMGSLVTLLAAYLVYLLPKEALIPVQDEKTIEHGTAVQKNVHDPRSTDNRVEEYMKKAVIFSHSTHDMVAHMEGISHIPKDQYQQEIKKDPYDIGFIFQRYDDRIDDYANVESWVGNLRKTYQLKTVVFIGYSKETSTTNFQKFKERLRSLDIHFLELTIKATRDAKEHFNKDALNTFLRKVAIVAKEKPEELQPILDATEPASFSVR